MTTYVQTPAPPRSKKILFADDEPNLRMSLTWILEDAGYEVTTAKNGQEALDYIFLQKQFDLSYDLLLTDIQMHDMTGLELMDKLSFHDISLPIVVITGHGDKALLTELLRRGCHDYLDKPVEANDVLARVHSVITNQESEKAKQEQEKQKFKENQQLKYDIKIENYQNNFLKLSKQVESAIDTYHKIMDLGKEAYCVKIAWKNRPLKELGGDFADIGNTMTGCNVMIADVAGHDLSASYHTVLLKAIFNKNCYLDQDPYSFFQLLNQQLYNNGENDRMVTALFLKICLDTMRGELVSAAHPFLIHRYKKTSGLKVYPVKTNSLGLSHDIELETQSFDIALGDQFFLYTDGLSGASRLNTEKNRQERLTTEGLVEYIENHNEGSIEEIVDKVWENVLSFCRNRPKDDMFLLGIEIPETLTSSQSAISRLTH